MRPALIAILIILALLAAGCTSSAPAVPAPAATPQIPAPVTIPDLKGTWAGTAEGYQAGIGYYNVPDSNAITLVVSEQHGRIFSGHVQVRVNQTNQTKEIAGVIGRDGRTFTMVEQGGGYSTGTITSDGIETTYMLDSPGFSIAIDTLKKV